MQKICIIGDGMSGLIAAAILGQENIKIDFYSSKEKKIKSKKDNRTTAISENNYKYLLNKFNLQSSKFFWPSKEVNLFYENDNQIKNFLNLKEQNENLMYIFKNNQFIRIIDRIILKNKKIKIVKKKIDKVDFSNGSILVKKQKFSYDLIVLCTGINSDLYKKITINRNIEKNYKEVAITTTIKHRSDIKNARQYFLNEGPLAILPFSNNSFSVVWSIDATFFDQNYKIIRNVLKSKIQTILEKIKISSIDNIHSYPLYLNLKTNYFKKNVLILGDGLHTVHPMAGQGFNLVIRDVKKLSELISRTVKLGILISNSNILKDFFNSRKPENNILGLGVNLTNMFFKNNKYFSPFRNILLENVKNFDFVKKLSKQISNKGISI